MLDRHRPRELNSGLAVRKRLLAEPRALVFIIGLLFCAASASADPIEVPVRVGFDAAHHNAIHADDLESFFKMIREDGFDVSMVDESWNESTFVELDVMMVMGPLSVARSELIGKGMKAEVGFDYYWWSEEGREDSFLPGEVRALIEWVRSGGNLLLVLDHAPSGSAARSLTEALGVDVRNSMTWDGDRRPPGYEYSEIDRRRASFILFSRELSSLGDHPIVNGRGPDDRVECVATYVGTSLVGPVDSTPLLLLSSQAFDFWKDPPERGGGVHRVPARARSQATAFELGEGRVVVVGEFTPFHESRGGLGDPTGEVGKGMAFEGADDRQFVLNIMRWLAGR